MTNNIIDLMYLIKDTKDVVLIDFFNALLYIITKKALWEADFSRSLRVNFRA